jgi:inorganic pyrophosphatase|eukprot:CAMPEP_0174300124 /NCGR_PEP_ID=MMETSP0809-20121228/58286_1 /TAXON_ID=73025 ORGANISM="Eutreptiella gymnastica-like, Strain CCMP1594" /NCGR_SAMPLE_ID=MMETSP0809 /ASSEMBLY_ACC=CAM_ASM_000658 /LENGTH=260 /DNA_ID=CAMNT_0015405661 /DNA_START=39 /DNA_END=821 /DNA_ORIENTATION=+
MRKFAPAALRFGRTFSKLATKVEGAPDTTDFSIYMTQDGMTVSPWHSVPYQQPNGLYTYINEIPKATTAKMEVSTKVELNPIKQDMKKGKLRYFTYDMGTNGIPFNYGLMPQTFEDPDESHPDTGCVGDADPIDLVELSPTPMTMGGVYQVKILGCLAMIDEGETDWKIIAINANDPRAAGLDTVADYAKLDGGQKQLDQVVQWFRMYKTSDGKPENSFAFGGQYKDRDYALRIIDEVHTSWKNLCSGKIPNKKGFWVPK